MSTQGKGTYLINSSWASGSLVFYEKAVGRTTTGDIFTLGTAAVKVGNTAQDVDLQWYGTGSVSAIFDCGAKSFTLTGVTMYQSATVTVTDSAALQVYGAATAGSQGLGLAAYFDATFGGQSTGNWTYGVGVWLNLLTTYIPTTGDGWGGHEQACAMNTGIYADTNTNMSDADLIYGMKSECIVKSTTNGCYFAALNVAQTAPATKTAIFFAHNNQSVGLGATKSGAAGGSIALACINGTIYYVNTYTS